MENLVSKSRLLWQQLHTTPPPVVLSLYLQNAQLSPKPALCWEETAVSLSLSISLYSLSLFYWRQSSNTSTLPLSNAGDEWGSNVTPFLKPYKIICVCISLWLDLNLEKGLSEKYWKSREKSNVYSANTNSNRLEEKLSQRKYFKSLKIWQFHLIPYVHLHIRNHSRCMLSK